MPFYEIFLFFYFVFIYLYYIYKNINKRFFLQWNVWFVVCVCVCVLVCLGVCVYIYNNGRSWMEQHFTLVTVPSALYNPYLFILCDDKRLIQYKYFLMFSFTVIATPTGSPRCQAAHSTSAPSGVHMPQFITAGMTVPQGQKGTAWRHCCVLCALNAPLVQFASALHQKETAMGHGTGSKILWRGLPRGVLFF
jgi:hypothetical protein